MSFTPRVFLNEDLLAGKQIKLTDKIFHYLANVLRKKINDSIIVVNGKDGEFLSEIIFMSNKYLNIKVIEKTKEFQKQPFLGLIFAPIGKIDLLLKSATELGTTDFYPINTEYTNKNNLKLNKIDGNIIEAVEQSERLDLPVIHRIEKLKDLLKKLDNEKSIILFCEERTGERTLKSINFKDKNIYALVGPEGGFSEQEKSIIRSFKNVVSVSLGSNILRTETATISVLSVIKFLIM